MRNRCSLWMGAKSQVWQDRGAGYILEGDLRPNAPYLSNKRLCITLVLRGLLVAGVRSG